MVRATGQKIAMPGRSKHQFKKAIDVGGVGEVLNRRPRVRIERGAAATKRGETQTLEFERRCLSD